MARAYNIHIVMSSGIVHGAFTVKHELESWLEQQDQEFLALVEIVTTRDGDPDEGKVYSTP